MTRRLLRLEAIHRVLVRCPNWLGDTVMAVPAIRALRESLPAAELVCVGPWVETVLATEPGVTRLLGTRRGWAARLAQARELRGTAPDLAVILPNSFETALFACVAGARWRIGYAGDGRTWLLTHPVRPAADARHQVASYLALLEPLGVSAASSPPSLAVSADRRLEARRLLAALGIGPGAVGIALGAAFGPSKLWSADRLGQLAVRLEGEGRPVVFLGSGAARPVLEEVARAMPTPPRHLVGRDHPALLPALVAELSVVVGPDSGPAHVAAAVGVDVVTLFGPTDPRLTAPLGEGATWIWRKPPCAPCFRPRCPIDHRCLRAVTVEDVLDAVLSRACRTP